MCGRIIGLYTVHDCGVFQTLPFFVVHIFQFCFGNPIFKMMFQCFFHVHMFLMFRVTGSPFLIGTQGRPWAWSMNLRFNRATNAARGFTLERSRRWRRWKPHCDLGFLKWWVWKPPNHPWINRGNTILNHPFWGTPYFLETPICTHICPRVRTRSPSNLFCWEWSHTVVCDCNMNSKPCPLPNFISKENMRRVVAFSTCFFLVVCHSPCFDASSLQRKDLKKEEWVLQD